jgi:FkbM family methyltransferase
MILFKQLETILNHPLNHRKKIHTFIKVVWWKINQVFFRIPAVIEMTKGAKLVCYPTSSYGSFVVYANFPEFEEMDFIKNIVSDGHTVIDVGANIGSISILSASQGKTVKVYAFEPTEKLIPYLQENININQFQNQIIIHQHAISNKNGTLKFVLESESEINHIHSGNNKEKNLVTVKSSTLDKIARDSKIKHVDLLKVDVEGAELLVFKGAKKLFKEKRIETIVFELNKNINNFGYSAKDLISLLKNNNFFVFKFENQKLILINENFQSIKTTNLVAILKDIKAIKKVIKYL